MSIGRRGPCSCWSWCTSSWSPWCSWTFWGLIGIWRAQ